MNRLTVLGFAVANQYQENTHLLIQTEAHTVLIDCGNNPVGKLQKVGVAINEITELILTHAHADHMGALPLLVMDMWLQKRQSPLHIYGLTYTLEKANALLNIYGWKTWQGMFPVEFHTVKEDSLQTLIQGQDLVVSALMVKHLIPTIGLRIAFSASRKTFVYSCDTEPCENLDHLAAGADLLLQEAAGPGKGHTSSEEAGVTASKAGVQQLVLIHYDAARPETELIAEARKHYSGDISLAKDLLFFE